MFPECSIILEHSFFLPQQHVQDPTAVSAEQYRSSGTAVRVSKALPELLSQYDPKKKAMAKMEELIMHMISEHLICKLYSCSVMTLYYKFIAKSCGGK